MWELRNRFSLGRLSKRRFSLVLTATLLTFFVATFALLSPHAYADSAVRSGQNLTYGGNTYSPATKNQMPEAITQKAPDTEAYWYTDTEAGKAYFIFTASDKTTATSAYYVVYDFNPPNDYTNPSPQEEITIAPEGTATEDVNNGEEVSSCDGATLSGIGWIVCPAVNFIAKGMDKIYQIISDFLVVRTVTADTSSSLYHLWMVIRDVANICFVIAILVIVYSQLTSIGLSNYGIKHMLPRLVIAAVLVNVSYWVCALAVDASNILGYAIHGLFTNLMDTFSVGDNYSGTIPTWQQVTAIALSGSAAVAGGLFVAANTVGGTVFLLIPFLLGVVIAALVALIVLAMRQALITIFVIISPLAFVAFILPNTEKYFTKWREAFMTLLLLFPIFSVVFSGAQLAGMAIIQSAGGNLFTIILGMAVQVAPIVITPILVKFSGSIIGKVAGMLNNPNKGLIDRTRNWARGAAQERRNKVLSDNNLTKKWNKWNPSVQATKGVNNYMRYRQGRQKAYEAAADTAFEGTGRGQTIEAMNRENAISKKKVDTAFERTARGQELMYRDQRADHDKTRAHNEFEGGQYGQKLDVERRTVEAEKKRIENHHQAHWDNSVRTDPGLLKLELGVKDSELKANAAKVMLEKMHAEITEQGDKSEHILNLRNVSAQTKDGLLTIARDINQSQVKATVANMAKTAAEQKMNSQTNDLLLKNTVQVEGVNIRKYAAGIGSQDAVLASSVARERKEFGEDVAHQKELSSHFKLNAGQIERLAMGQGNVEIKDKAGNVIHTFRTDDEYVRDMAVEEIFTVGSHTQKMNVIKTAGEGNINFDSRRTIQQAAIKSGIGKIAPAVNDKALDDLINGKFSGDESWQYHSFREILEGRLNASTLSTANAASLELLFANVGDSALTQSQFAKLVDDNVKGELDALRVSNPAATEAEARQSILDRYEKERADLRKMAAQVLSTPTIRQNSNAQSIAVLKKFAGRLYKDDD